jgi:hypothetical protein
MLVGRKSLGLKRHPKASKPKLVQQSEPLHDRSTGEVYPASHHLPTHSRHPGGGRDPRLVDAGLAGRWTLRRPPQLPPCGTLPWVSACAGMTERGVGGAVNGSHCSANCQHIITTHNFFWFPGILRAQAHKISGVFTRSSWRTVAPSAKVKIPDIRISLRSRRIPGNQTWC